jgi:Mn2+/Fe2+ NRAMP family transporter
MSRHYSCLLVSPLSVLLLIANVINIGADLDGMEAALRLAIDGPQPVFVALFAAVTVLLEFFIRYSRWVGSL